MEAVGAPNDLEVIKAGAGASGTFAFGELSLTRAAPRKMATLASPRAV